MENFTWCSNVVLAHHLSSRHWGLILSARGAEQEILIIFSNIEQIHIFYCTYPFESLRRLRRLCSLRSFFLLVVFFSLFLDYPGS